MKNQTPNSDSANDGNLSGILLEWLQSYIREHHDDMMPAKVISYNDKTNRAVIKPLVMVLTTDGGRVSRTNIPNIPVFRFGGGGFFIRFPIKAGDFGWIKANDRDMSLMMRRGGQEDIPNTKRLHSFSDAMFFPDTLKDWVIDGENSDAMVLQSLSGGVCIALHEGKLTMKAPELFVDIPKTTWIGNIDLTGGLSSKGGEFTHNGVNVGSGHTHGNVQQGNETSGVPVK